ncbi:GNAT family N-acetyltransferase [Flavivirga aquimarina]|uniref:GNAT family N-acetyltransferase n=1 Tax=Flavivirga aquimarina TaxID=2027862 RepID=A0ABT8W5F7_9FLAO|nr:GNAT family N-acetyltransferase [Flavivirga aquimarina]MDO5968307.1 GNAT family N-acetyltransferase [Flavivirga aquimarina]
MIKASNKDKEIVIDILTSAFESYKEDSSINLIVKQDEKRVERMRVLMGYLFERAMLFGDVFLSDDKEACVLIKYTEKEKVTLKTIWFDIGLVFRCIGVKGLIKVIKRQYIAKRHYPKENHIRPMIIGVKSGVKGKIKAGKLMLSVLKYHSANKLPVIIDTVSEYNLRLYQKIGFKIIEKETSLGFPIYFLRIN